MDETKFLAGFHTEAMKARGFVLVFEHKPGRKVRGYYCYPCVEDVWKADKFHAPVWAKLEDLRFLKEKCILCGKDF
jgi:hypothetical protein